MIALCRLGVPITGHNWTAAYFCVVLGKPDTLDALIRMGLNVRSGLVDYLAIAYERGSEHCARVLLHYGVKLRTNNRIPCPAWVPAFLATRERVRVTCIALFRALRLRGMPRDVCVLIVRPIWRNRHLYYELMPPPENNTWCCIA